jgi:hypothetical protein
MKKITDDESSLPPSSLPATTTHHQQQVSSLSAGVSRVWGQGEACDEHVRRVFLFSLMWSVGAVLELEDRKKLEVYLRDEADGVRENLEFPPRRDGFGESMFDFVVDDSGTYRQPGFLCTLPF